jgi:hypothetical protein
MRLSISCVFADASSPKLCCAHLTGFMKMIVAELAVDVEMVSVLVLSNKPG